MKQATKRAARLKKQAQRQRAKDAVKVKDATEPLAIESLGLNAEGRPHFRIQSGPAKGTIVVYQGTNDDGEVVLSQEA